MNPILYLWCWCFCFGVLTTTTVNALTVDTTTDLSNDNGVDSIQFVNRIYVPYGPLDGDDTADKPFMGYGYGTGAMEHFAYDTKEGYIYAQSQAGAYISIIDYCLADKGEKAVTNLSLDLSNELEDEMLKNVLVCPVQGLLIVSLKNNVNVIKIYETVKRSSPAPPVFIKDIDTGDTTPHVIATNADCTILAVTNQNKDRNSYFLNDASMTLFTGFASAIGEPVVTKVKLTGFTDEELLANNVHMPLTQQAMKYWNSHSSIADGLNWDELVKDDKYDPALFLDPEFIAFNHDDSEIYLNLQDNSAIARIHANTGEVLRIDGMGLKAWHGTNKIDIVNDGGCKLSISDPILYTTYSPYGIASVTVDGSNYLLTADEGDTLAFESYQETVRSHDIFDKDSISMPGFTFLPEDSFSSLEPHLNKACLTANEGWCANLLVSIGSSSVDYRNETKPVLKNIVGVGGRGMSILKIPSSTEEAMQLMWTSGDEFEQKGCEQIPWAHNALQDETFAPYHGTHWKLSNSNDRDSIQAMNDPSQGGCANKNVNNDDPSQEQSQNLKGLPGACPMSQTVDNKAEENGLGVESIVVGVACQTLVAVACGGNNSNCYLYNISDMEAPVLLQVFNLSPASETANPAYAYDKGKLGDIDPKNIMFVQAQYSPSGNDGIIFGGAVSGTLSFWDFQCTAPLKKKPVAAVNTDMCHVHTHHHEQSHGNSKNGLSSGSIFAICFGSLVFGTTIVGIYFLTARSKRRIRTNPSFHIANSEIS